MYELNNTVEIIQQLAKKREISINKMLQEIGISRYTIDSMKRGREPSAKNIVSIATYLEVSTDYLLGLTDDPTPPKRNEE